MAIDWSTEEPVIKTMSQYCGVDFAFIKAIRVTENGGPGKEFGVLSVHAPSYNDQLEIACKSVAHQLTLYHTNPLVRNSRGRLCYSTGFIQTFSLHWAPSGAANDPTGLNSNWFKNCSAEYSKFSI